MHVRTKRPISIIKIIKVGYIYSRLRENKNVLVKVIRRIKQIFLAARNNDNEIKIWNLKDNIIYYSDHRRHENDKDTR